jgi:translation initiation factor 1
MAKGRKPRVSVDGSEGPLRQPVAGLAALRERLQAGASPAPVEPEPSASPSSGDSVYARSRRIVVRRERKGHGGKSATRIEGLVGASQEVDAVMRELKRALGCGAARDGTDVVVQGEPGERLVAFLESRGARKVVLGN